MKPTSIRLRSGTLDTIRGLTLVSMIVYHACWDLVYLYRLDWGWYRSFWAGIWQQSICCTFILLSGYCWQMGRHPLRRGLMSFFGGAAVSLATLLVLPETPVQFGVLTFLGSAALLTIPLRPLLSRIPPPASSPRTTSPCCPGCFSSGQGFISTACGLKPPPCRISACRGSAPSGGAPSWSICCTSR